MRHIPRANQSSTLYKEQNIFWLHSVGKQKNFLCIFHVPLSFLRAVFSALPSSKFVNSKGSNVHSSRSRCKSAFTVVILIRSIDFVELCEQYESSTLAAASEQSTCAMTDVKRINDSLARSHWTYFLFIAQSTQSHLVSIFETLFNTVQRNSRFRIVS